MTTIFKLIHDPNDSEPWKELEYFDDKNIHKFIEVVNELNNITYLNQYSQPILFRGQSNSKWQLKPKLYRFVDKIPLENALGLELDSINYFKQFAYIYLSPQIIPELTNLASWVALMQQYGAPTRMLDWTTSFNVALYFAVTDDPIDKPGAVWFFEVSKLRKLMQHYKPISKDEATDIISNKDKFIKYGCNKARPKIDIYDIPIKSERISMQHSIFTSCEQLFRDHALIIGKSCRSTYMITL